MTHLTEKEVHRYQRHLLMPEIGSEGQIRLKNAKVVIVGMGGLGCPAAQYLVGAGVGTLGIVDNDCVAISNLQRQLLFDTNQIGTLKVLAAKTSLERINPHVNIIPYPIMLTKNNVLSIFKEYDLVIDATDNFPSRYLINDAAKVIGIPVVYGAVYKFEGQVSVFNYKGGAVYSDLIPHENHSNELSCNSVGVLGVLPGLIGMYQAIECLKIILRLGKVLSGKLLVMNTLYNGTELLEIEKKSPEMTHHEALTFFKSQNYSSPICNEKNTTMEVTSKHMKKLWAKREGLLFVDMRQPDEHPKIDDEAIEKWPGDALLNAPEKLLEYEKVVIGCQRGIRSAKLVNKIREKHGLSHTYSLKGGMLNWINELKNQQV